ncbi:hypothetical protein APHAL10511_002315 [Amanita phalloides]|nr:hypothetical protein APHAL10511_002315 [Amanita phalloides]
MDIESVNRLVKLSLEAQNYAMMNRFHSKIFDTFRNFRDKSFDLCSLLLEKEGSHPALDLVKEHQIPKPRLKRRGCGVGVDEEQGSSSAPARKRLKVPDKVETPLRRTFQQVLDTAAKRHVLSPIVVKEPTSTIAQKLPEWDPTKLMKQAADERHALYAKFNAAFYMLECEISRREERERMRDDSATKI